MAGISVVDRKLLWGHSGNECAFPNCAQLLTAVPAEEGAISGSIELIVVGEEAHIVAEEDNGPRGNPSMPIPDRNSYPNLILLCVRHHRIIDKDHGVHYSVEQLHDMKAKHEASVRSRLASTSTAHEIAARKRQDVLLEAASASRGRLVARWLAAGVNPEIAQALADDPAIGAVARLDYVLPSNGLVTLVGDFGCGKSVTAERIYNADNAVAIDDETAPLPAYLVAKSVAGPLMDAVRSAVDGLGEPSRNGVRLILDGLDEPGQARAAELLNEARALVFTWPNTRIIVTARPGLPINKDELNITYPALSEDEAAALAERLGGHRALLWEQSEPIREMLHLPLFLIVAALRQQAGAVIPRSRGTFLEALATTALERSHQSTEQARQALKTLACLTVGSGGPVPAAELGSVDAVSAALETRLVVREGRSLRFALPVVEQYFAAQAVLTDGLEALDLDDLGLLDRWRDSLTLAVTVGSWRQVSALLDILAAKHPGLTAWLVTNAVPGSSTETSGSLPSHIECARRLHHALAAWIDALEPTGRLLGLKDGQGQLRTVGTFVDGARITAALRLGDSGGVNAMQLPLGLHPFTGQAPDGSQWTPLRLGNVPAEFAAWPWQWALTWVTGGLEQVLKAKVLLLPDSKPFQDERRWHLARCLVGKSRNLLHGPIDGADLQRIADEVLAQMNERGLSVYRTARLGHQPAAFSRDEIATLVDGLDGGEILAEDGLLHRPYPAPDRPPVGGWVSHLYSEETLCTLIEQVHHNALMIYHDLVASWFPGLAPTLGLASFMPILISGQMARRTKPASFGDPEFIFHMTPLPLDQSPRAEIHLVGDFEDFRGFDPQRAREQYLLLKQQIESLHSGAASWAFPQSADSSVSFWHDRPATSLAYRWLWEDLRRLHLVKQLPPTVDE